jgi:ABC-type phosphate transport system substrate-binding protein
MLGSASVVPVAQSWAKAYQSLCGYSNQITVSTTTSDTGAVGNTAGVLAVCGVGQTPIDVGLLTRPLISPTEAIQSTKNTYLYTCAKGQTSRVLTEVQVAIDGIAFVAALGNTASNCIASLPGGGLTFSQVRWIYSSFSLAKLRTEAQFDSAAVPNSDGKDSTHLWSELCVGSSCNCPAIEIGIAGEPSTSSYYSFFLSKFLTGTGETVRGVYQSDPSDSPNYVVDYVTTNTAALGFTSFASYNNNVDRVYAASIEDPLDGEYLVPTFAQFASGEYPSSFYLYMEVSSTVLDVVQDFFVYAYSNAGNKDVSSTGLFPLTAITAVRMLSRLGATGGVSLSQITCGPGGSIFMGGATTVYPQAVLWGGVYADACGVAVTVFSGGSTPAAQFACGIPVPGSGTVANIATMSRQFLSSEAVLPAGGNGYDYQCVIGTKRTVREFPVGIDGITFAFPLNGAASQCIATLPGKGLTIDQLRWIYSSYTYAQLVANGWDPKSLPNYIGSDTDHFWFELGGSGCVPEEIFIAGSPSTTGTFQYFVSVTMTGPGETVAMNRPTGYFYVPDNDPDEVVAFLQQTSPSIGFFGYSYYAKNTQTLGAASIKNKAGVFVPPTETTFVDGSYNPYTRPVYMQLETTFLEFQTTSAFVMFGTETTEGDTLTVAAGLFPISAATKTLIKPRFTLTVPCFSETSTVQVFNKGVIAMKDLQIGDQVINANGKFDTVYSFGHYAPDIQAEFIQIHALGLSQPLEISKEHMIFKASGAAVPASAIAVGDRLQLYDGVKGEVKKILTVIRHGAYAPFTMSGTIVVNNVVTSSYVDLQNKVGFLIIGSYQTPLSMQFLAHMFQAPHRLACKISPIYCQKETYDESGISSWVAGPFALAEWAIRQNVVIMSCIFSACFVVGLAIYVVELMFTNNLMLLMVAVGCSFLAVRRTSKKEA